MKREKIKEITLSRIIKQEVVFCEWDFETVEEFDEFVLKLKSDKDFMLAHFFDNVDEENYEVIEGIKVEE
jgi:hypothetical protein